MPRFPSLKPPKLRTEHADGFLRYREDAAGVLGAADRIAHVDAAFARFERRNERDMPEKDRQFSLRPADGQLNGISVIPKPVRCGDFKMKRFHNACPSLCFAGFRFGYRLVDRTDEEERGLGQIVVLAVENFFKAADRLLKRHVLTGKTGILLRHVERLRQKTLDFSRTDDGLFVVLGKLVHTHDRDNIL